ncbi:MAG: GNAT family N-acetyltransferase [Acidimicrobiia bacterium]|nr:GNAT family N-acetyltransferase [Acidimicrobiia bacterium]
MNDRSTASADRSASVVLGNGDTAVIRPLVPDDRAALSAFHERQSPTSIYRRFFSPKPSLSDKDLEHFTTVDMVDRVALAVELRDEFVAWASYERWPGRNEAEAAFMVDDDHTGLGMATLLLEHLAAYARTNGIDRFTAEVLGDNRAMLAVFAKAGWPLKRRFDSGVIDLDWEIKTTDEYLDSVEAREQRADSRAVARMLLPRAVAVIGASDRPGAVGTFLWNHVVSSVQVPAYPVNPAHDDIGGHQCLHSIDDLPDEVSLAVIAVPTDVLEDTIDACIRKRMRGAVIITATDGSDIDLDALVGRARRNGLRIIGPSSMGIASPRAESRIQAALVDVALPPGRVAISMQSGSLGGSVLRRAAALQLGLSWFVSLGDKSDVSSNDLLQFWEDDDNTRVIALYTESFGNPSKFARLARRVSRARPIVAVRAGRAAEDMGSALFQQAGLIEVPTVQDMLDTARVLAGQPVLRGPRVAVLTNSRSPGTLATHALASYGLEPVAPPVALDWRSDDDAYRAALTAALDSDTIDGVLVIHAPAVADDVKSVVTGIEEAASGGPKPVVAVMLGAADGPISRGSDVPAFTFPEQAAATLGRSYSYGRWLTTEAAGDPDPHREVNPVAARASIDHALAEVEACSADIATQRELLTAYGIFMPVTRLTEPADAVRIAGEIGYPIAVKARHRRAGRSARAGVALDLGSDSDVRRSVDTMRESLGADADEVTVQAMATPGVDVRVRCEHDDRLGVIVHVGLGGVQADVIADRTTRLAPVSPATAMAMLGETRVLDALTSADIDPSALVDVVVEAAQLAENHPEISLLDLNPIVVSGDGPAVVDATIALHRHQRLDEPLRKLD